MGLSAEQLNRKKADDASQVIGFEDPLITGRSQTTLTASYAVSLD